MVNKIGIAEILLSNWSVMIENLELGFK